MAKQRVAVLAVLAATACAVGCARPRPVLYPNKHLEQVGPDAADADIAECMELAKAQGLQRRRVGQTAGSTVVGGAVGAAVGGAVGAVTGNPARGAAAGAAGGGVGGFFRGLFGTRAPAPLYKRYVDICLQERGYRSLGWK